VKTLRNVDGVHANTFPPSYQPENSLIGHLEFMVKHERIHLEFLARLFAKTGPEDIAAWVLNEPSGRYSRRLGWFYEWLTGEQLSVPDTTNAPYVNALETDRYWTAALKPKLNSRWHVRDNMPGTPDYCPMVVLTDPVRTALRAADIQGAFDGLKKEFGADLLLRSAVWLTIKESRSSFEIEGERDVKKTERFAIAMEKYVGNLPDVLSRDELELLQREILGERAIHYGIRQSPIFVGQVARFQQIVHYVAPPDSMLASMLTGLRACDVRTQGSNPLVRAAVLSFAFVYIHPFSDGNGRMSRFLINDVLRKDGVIEEPFVLPVSATIVKDQAAFDRILDRFSAPFRRRYSASWRFGKETKYPDGEVSNFEFDEYQDAEFAWKYIDVSDHVAYMADVVNRTVIEEMHEEATYLRRHLQARSRLNELIQGSDNTLDRIIRSVGQTQRISGSLAADYPILEDEALANQVVQAVLGALEGETNVPSDQTEAS
jgi:hypothetical protein